MTAHLLHYIYYQIMLSLLKSGFSMPKSHVSWYFNFNNPKYHRLYFGNILLETPMQKKLTQHLQIYVLGWGEYTIRSTGFLIIFVVVKLTLSNYVSR